MSTKTKNPLNRIADALEKITEQLDETNTLLWYMADNITPIGELSQKQLEIMNITMPKGK